nr:MAG TPA: hypothetical protein [Caudoviricetes sp.]
MFCGCGLVWLWVRWVMAVIKISVLAFLVTWRHNSVVNLIKE